jgi:hypothetical protein
MWKYIRENILLRIQVKVRIHMNLDWLRFRQRKRAFVLLVVCIRCVFISLRFWVLVFAGYVFRVDGKRIRNKMIADKNEFCSG